MLVRICVTVVLLATCSADRCANKPQSSAGSECNAPDAGSGSGPIITADAAPADGPIITADAAPADGPIITPDVAPADVPDASGPMCGDRRCLGGELCQEVHETTGTGGMPGPTRYSCQPVPPACPGGQPSCTCAASTLPRCRAEEGCGCTDSAPRTLRCDCRNQ